MGKDAQSFEPGQFVRLGHGSMKRISESYRHRMRAKIIRVSKKRVLVQIPGHGGKLEWVSKKGMRVWKAKTEEDRQERLARLKSRG